MSPNKVMRPGAPRALRLSLNPGSDHPPDARRQPQCGKFSIATNGEFSVDIDTPVNRSLESPSGFDQFEAQGANPFCGATMPVANEVFSCERTRKAKFALVATTVQLMHVRQLRACTSHSISS